MSLLTSTFGLYGKGVFTTLAVEAGRPLLWAKHWRRFNEHAGQLGIDLTGHSEESVLGGLMDAIESYGETAGRARLTIADTSVSDLWPSRNTTGASADLSIVIGERRTLRGPFRLTVSIHRINTTSPLAGLKTCNYLDQLMALDEARRRGFDEAVRINEAGLISSGCMSNIFWESEGRLHTPATSSGCMAGTTREFVLENEPVDEVEADLESLNRADAIYLTSAGLGIRRVDEFNGRILEGDPARMLELERRLYAQ